MKREHIPHHISYTVQEEPVTDMLVRYLNILYAAVYRWPAYPLRKGLNLHIPTGIDGVSKPSQDDDTLEQLSVGLELL